MDESANETPQAPQAGGFAELGLEADLVEAVERARLETPTQVQRELIPLALLGRDCLVRVRPGSGKTNAYILPMVQRMKPGGGLQALVLLPTGALAERVERFVARFAHVRRLRTTALTARGRSRHEPDPLLHPPECLISTPRSVLEALTSSKLDPAGIRLVVLDEVDSMLDGDHGQTLRDVLDRLGPERQTIVLASELSDPVRELAGQYLREPETIDVAADESRVRAVEHCLVTVEPGAEFDALVAYCKTERPRLAIVFANQETTARELAHRLSGVGCDARWVGQRRRPPRGRDRSDRRRERAEIEVVTASDPPEHRLSTIPATHVLHYESPADADSYLHRIERCARLLGPRISVVFADSRHQQLLDEIEARLRASLRRLEMPVRPPRPTPRPAVPREARPAPLPAPAPPLAPAPLPLSNYVEPRLLEVLHRDEQLEARGIRPVPRTLGSRFRARRARRPV